MIQETLEIPAGDGVTEALLVRPESNDPLPAIINLTDGLGFRPAFAEQSKRIAERGYVVLTPNIFYRVSKSPVFPFEPDFADERSRQRFAELKAPMTTAAMERDGSAYVDFLLSLNSLFVHVAGCCSSQEPCCSLKELFPLLNFICPEIFMDYA